MSGQWPFGDLQRNHYGVITADCPWSFKLWSRKDLSKSPDHHYSCMTLDDIRALPVSDLAARDCVLIMWATAPMLDQQIDVLKGWGFQFKTAGSWAKRSSTGAKWAFGTGYVFRSAAEFYLVGTRGKPRSAVRDVRNLIVAPVREHSRKPDQMRTDLERMFPEVPRCELFGRQRAENWDVWGNQTDRFAA